MNIFELFGKIGIDNKSANKAIDETTGKAEGAHGKLSAIFGKIGQLAAKAGKVMATGLAIGITALAGLTGAATKHYAEYEQLVGGIETLFGAGGKSLEEYAQSVGKSVDDASDEYNKLVNAQEDLLNKSKIAYKTAGLSANQYMETATSFSASLIQSVGGDTQKAAKLADQAIIDMSDNANKMGSSMESIQNAYQGFAKQNYTMLDNLKLGYGGTKEEMQRLLEDAEKISGIKYDISSFADVTEAIHVMQEEMGIAGTTSKEAASTISGSIGMVKAAWENFLTGMADPDQDFGALVDNLTESIGLALGNIVPRLVETLPRIINGLSQVITTLAGYLPEILGALLPGLIAGATQLLGALATTLPAIFGIVFNQVLPQVINAFETFLEQVFSTPPGTFDGLSTAFEAVINLFKEGATRFGDFISWIQKGGPAVNALKSAVIGVTTAWTGYKAVTSVIKGIELAKNVALGIGNGLMIARAVQSGALTAAEGAQAAATVAGTGAQWAFNAAMAANPIMLVVMAIAALVAGLVYFFTQTEIGREAWSSFVSFLSAIWDGVVNAWNVAWGAITAFFEPIVSNISAFVKSIFGDLQQWWTENQALIQSTFETVWNAIKVVWETVIGGMVAYISQVWATISTIVTAVLDVLGPYIAGVWEAIKTTASTVWSVIKNNIMTVINVIQGIIRGVMQAINGDWSGALETVKGVALTIWNGIKANIETVINGISSAISSVMAGISGTVSNVWNGIKDTISNAINAAKDAVSNALNAIKGLFNFEWSLPRPKIPGFSISGGEAPWGFMGKGSLPKIGIEWYAKGGIMTAPTLFGFNGNNAMVGGEAGPEAILPLNDKTFRSIGQGIREASEDDNQPKNVFNITINVDGNGQDEETLAKRIAGLVQKEIVRSMVT